MIFLCCNELSQKIYQTMITFMLNLHITIADNSEPNFN